MAVNKEKTLHKSANSDYILTLVIMRFTACLILYSLYNALPLITIKRTVFAQEHSAPTHSQKVYSNFPPVFLMGALSGDGRLFMTFFDSCNSLIGLYVTN